MTPVRIQRSRKHKQVSPNGLPIVYCGRPGKYGNNYKIGDQVMQYDWKKLTTEERKLFPNFTITTAEAAIHLFKRFQLPTMDLAALKGNNLSCWCKEGDLCHADVLLEIANS